MSVIVQETTEERQAIKNVQRAVGDLVKEGRTEEAANKLDVSVGAVERLPQRHGVTFEEAYRISKALDLPFSPIAGH